MSCASISAAPVDRICSSTRWASSASWSSPTGRPWQALRTPETIFGRLNGSVTPDRLTTVRLAVSTVLKRRPHCGQTRRRRMAQPSSVLRESTTRESAERQNGQYMAFDLLVCGRRPLLLGTTRRSPVEEPGDYMWMAYSGVTTRCGVTVGLPPDGCKRSRRVARAGTRDMRGHLGRRRDTPESVVARVPWVMESTVASGLSGAWWRSVGEPRIGQGTDGREVSPNR